MSNELELYARRIAARKMGLKDDFYGRKLPDDLWKQCLNDAERELEKEIERFGGQIVCVFKHPRARRKRIGRCFLHFWEASLPASSSRSAFSGLFATAKFRAIVEIETMEAKTMTPEQDQAIFPAYLGIMVLATMCKKAGLILGEQRARELLTELDTAFPGLAGRSALRAPRMRGE